MFTHLDLFSGIGGFALAARWAGIETIGFVEIDKFCQKVLNKHWPDVPIVEDIHDIEGIKKVVGNKSVDLITGGFPCQPFSVAGKQRGTEDDRYLWPAMLNVIKEFKPTWVIGENVAGIVNMALADVLSDLENAGYEVQPFVIPACAVNAPHRRDRVWIVANAQSNGNGGRRIYKNNQDGERQGIQTVQDNRHEARSPVGTDNAEDIRDRFTPNADRTGNGTPTSGTDGNRQTVSQESEQPQPEYIGQNSHATDTTEQGLQGTITEREVSGRCFTQCDSIPGWQENWYAVAAKFCRVDAGVSNRVDRLKSLGNAIVPQVAYEIIKQIKVFCD